MNNPRFSTVRKLIRSNINLIYRDLSIARESYNSAGNHASENNSYGSPYKFGVIKEFFNFHTPYETALKEMGIPYTVIDISVDNWISEVNNSNCDIFLFWPSSRSRLWNSIYYDRAKIMVEDLNKVIFPSLKEIWLYENKHRVRDYLQSHNIPHPKTWVFYDRGELMTFIDNCQLPIVYKSIMGATAAGVKIFRNRDKLSNFCLRSFDKGFVPYRMDLRDKQWGIVILQEFIEDCQEWRMIRIGDSYYGYLKLREGDFHSGSGKFSMITPPKKLFDFLKLVTDEGNFSSLNVDVFETKTSSLLVNEMQIVFGASHPADMLHFNGINGRMTYNSDLSEKWQFQAGDWSRNACANERIRFLLESDYVKNYKMMRSA